MSSQLSPSLRQRIADTRWYHVLELGEDVVTPGEFDLRAVAPRVPLPLDLTGKRCLDVGTRDGFWAFEMERRGASEVVGIDVGDTTKHDWPLPRPVLPSTHRDALAAADMAFGVAKEALGAQAQWRDVSVYDLDPSDVGTFDVAFLGTLLTHLRDPIGALSAVRRVLRPGGVFVVNEGISISLSLLRRTTPSASLMTLDAPFWWVPNRAALIRWIEAAGFECEEIGRPYLVNRGPTMDRPKFSRRNYLGNPARQLLLRAGMPHVAILARPRPDRVAEG